MTATRFFVYGSMSEGMVHFTKIQDFVLSSVPASIQATAYRLQVGFPVLVREAKDVVFGQLVELKASDLLISLLDEFFGVNKFDPEKSVYSREQISVCVARPDDQTGDQTNESASKAVDAWAYFLNPKKLPASAELIEGGDWQASLQQQPDLTKMLTEKQIYYIRRLGISVGREIIPIDLPLYRELMKLEMIVDKGRRLALSKLGREVFRHLG